MMQDPPNAVQIEMTEGCNLYCDFCGLQGIRQKDNKDYRFMTVPLATLIAKQIQQAGWTPRIEFAMHGEPTMNPDAPEIIAAFRSHLPKAYIMVTTNGGGLFPRFVAKATALFDAGVNVIALDAYENVRYADKAMDALANTATLTFEVHDYPAERDFSPHTRRTGRNLVFVEDISLAENGTHSSLNNHCGAAAPPPAEPLKARCAKPFRELSVRYDGTVPLCCNDWRGEYMCGDIQDTPIDELWQNRAFDTARKFLYHYDRAGLTPCDKCNAKSYRVGLLPDKLGKSTLPRPTVRDRVFVQKQKAVPPAAPVVFRPWEKDK